MQPFLSAELTLFLLISVLMWVTIAAAGTEYPEPLAHIKGPLTHPVEITLQTTETAEESKPIKPSPAPTKPVVASGKSTVPAWCRYFGLRARRAPIVRVAVMEE